MKRILTLSAVFLSATVTLFSQNALSAADSAAYPVYYWHSKDLFDHLPDIDGEIIFFGNSITDFGEWHELLGNNKCLNRGISGDITDGLLLRLDGIIRVKPAKVFILIGINDLSHGKSAEYITANYEQIIRRIKTGSPCTQIYVQSVFPIHSVYEMKRPDTVKTWQILELNESLRKLAEREECTYVDIFTKLSDGDNHLKKAYSLDGLHLTYEGYKVWVDVIRPLI